MQVLSLQTDEDLIKCHFKHFYCSLQAVQRRQTLCPGVLRRHHGEEMEPVDESKEQDACLKQTAFVVDTWSGNSLLEGTQFFTPQAANVCV